jgi:hypothetical protein
VQMERVVHKCVVDQIPVLDEPILPGYTVRIEPFPLMRK